MSEKDKNWGKKADLPTGSRSWSKGIHDYAPGHLHITPTGAAQPRHQVIRASATSEHLVCNKSTYSSFHPLLLILICLPGNLLFNFFISVFSHFMCK